MRQKDPTIRQVNITPTAPQRCSTGGVCRSSLACSWAKHRTVCSLQHRITEAQVLGVGSVDLTVLCCQYYDDFYILNVFKITQ